jgi:hypothetical protein
MISKKIFITIFLIIINIQNISANFIFNYRMSSYISLTEKKQNNQEQDKNFLVNETEDCYVITKKPPIIVKKQPVNTLFKLNNAILRIKENQKMQKK